MLFSLSWKRRMSLESECHRRLPAKAFPVVLCVYRTVGEVAPGLIGKCLNGRQKMKERAFDILLMYVEIERQADIEEELVKSLENKQPKIVQACLELLRKGLSYVSSLHAQRTHCLLFYDAESSAPKFFPSNHFSNKSFRY
jgi:hypothetical protein